MSEIWTVKELLESGNLERGSWISRTALKDISYTITSGKSGCNKDQVFSIKKGQEILGRFMKEENGILQVAGRVEDFEVSFRGVFGFENGVFELNNLCCKLYSSLEHGIVTYSINEEQYDILSKPITVENIVETVEEKDRIYWLAKHAISRIGVGLGMKYVRNGIKETYYLFDFNKKLEEHMTPCTSCICPWHFLTTKNPNLKVLVGRDCNGMSRKTPYRIVLD